MLARITKRARTLIKGSRRPQVKNRALSSAVTQETPPERPADYCHSYWEQQVGIHLEWRKRDHDYRLIRYQYPRLWKIAELNREFLVTQLDKAKVNFFDSGEAGKLRSYLAVTGDDWSLAMDVISGADFATAGDPIYMDIITDDSETTVLFGTHSRAQLDFCRELRIYRLQRAAPELSVLGREARCTLQKWARDETDPSLFRAPYSNAVASAIHESMLRTQEKTEWGVVRKRISAIGPPLQTVDSPIDAVYLWVDGGDPDWIARKQRAQGLAYDEHSHHLSRFRDRGELRYSMRSLLFNAPWIRNIYLVTDAQLPDWLDVSSSRITVVDHRDIFGPESGIPNFNSQAIASRVHKIPGLAEQYIIMNDDVFFNRPAAPDLFFTPAGGVVVPMSRTLAVLAPFDWGSPVDAARKNTARLIERDFNRTPIHIFRHTPIPQLRSLMYELEERYRTEFDALEKSQFRSRDDYEVNGWLHHNVALLTDRGVVKRHPYRYIDLSSELGKEHLESLRPHDKTVTFCINDLGDDDEGSGTEYLARWLPWYFPEKCEVEI